MAQVRIKPMPEAYRNVPKRLWCQHPPIFLLEEGETKVSDEDIQLARELFKLLDDQSKAWYRRSSAARLFKDL
jgi:hypothetical protein